MKLIINIKPFSFQLTRKLITSQGIIHNKVGFLLQIKDSDGNCGWGEVSPIENNELKKSIESLDFIGRKTTKDSIENYLCELQGLGALTFGLGASLADLENLTIRKLDLEGFDITKSAYLLPTDVDPLESIVNYIDTSNEKKSSCTIKWKVSNQENNFKEEKILQKILAILPKNFKLRIDPNGGWSRQKAQEWSNELKNEPRLEWIEQPLPSKDIEGLFSLANQIPIALDESLVEFPYLRKTWNSWQIRRPTLEGDPRLLLKEIEQKDSQTVISTAFETGIGRRWINHLAARQVKGKNSCAPGLAPGWCPTGPLFNNNPKLVWEAV
jgi:O-succinylbenzoate synthase